MLPPYCMQTTRKNLPLVVLHSRRTMDRSIGTPIADVVQTCSVNLNQSPDQVDLAHIRQPTSLTTLTTRVVSISDFSIFIHIVSHVQPWIFDASNSGAVRTFYRTTLHNASPKSMEHVKFKSLIAQKQSLGI
jgi:hypothetical protein